MKVNGDCGCQNGKSVKNDPYGHILSLLKSYFVLKLEGEYNDECNRHRANVDHAPCTCILLWIHPFMIPGLLNYTTHSPFARDPSMIAHTYRPFTRSLLKQTSLPMFFFRSTPYLGLFSADPVVDLFTYGLLTCYLLITYLFTSGALTRLRLDCQ